MSSQDITGAKDRLQPGSRRIFIDALNLAYWCGNPPSLRLPMSLLSHLLSAGHEAMLYFDASARHRLKDEAEYYERLIQQSRYVIEVPSGRTADGVMLRHATSTGACILSRDKYRDYRRRYRKLIDDPSRLIPGVVENDCVLAPGLGLNAALASSVDQAWRQLEPLLESYQAMIVREAV